MQHNIKKVFSILRSCLPPSVKFTEPQVSFIYIAILCRMMENNIFVFSRLQICK